MTEMSETTAAGVDVLNSFDHTLSAEDEELMLHQRILQSKSLDDRRARQRAEEDLKFARHKISERDRKLEEARAKLAVQSTTIGSLTKQLELRDSQNATLKAQVHDLTVQMDSVNNVNFRELEQMRESLNASRMLSGSICSNVPDNAGSGKLTRQHSNLSNYIAQKAKNIGLRRKFKSVATYHEKANQAMECALMEEADMHSVVTERCLARGVQPINDLLKAEMGLDVDVKDETNGDGKRVSCLVSYDGLKRYGRGNNNVLSFNEPLVCKMPEDVFIDAKVKASSFNAEYEEFRKSVHSFAKTFKKDSDNALNGLWFIFTEKDKGPRSCVLANPKEDFQKEVRAALTKTKTNLLDLVRTFNTNMKSLLGNERRVKQQWLLEQRPVRHMEVQVDIPPPEDPRIAELQDEVNFLRSRQAQIHEEHTGKSQDLEMHREKAEVNMQFLQQKVFSLHNAVHTALHSVYKHRYHWGPRCPNHFAPLNQDKAASKKRQLEVGYNVLLGQAIDLEIKSLGQFADYFVSDQLFGVDLAAAFNPVSTKEQDSKDGAGKEDATCLVMRKKEAVPMKKFKVDQARKLSTQLDTMLREEKATVATGSPPTATLDAMEQSTKEKENVVNCADKVQSATPPPVVIKKVTSPFTPSTQQSGTTTSGRRSSTTNVPSCATRTTSNTRRASNISPPNAHVDAANTGTSHKQQPQATAAFKQVTTATASTINLELGIDIGAAPPKAPPVARFQNNRRTSTVGGFVAFAQS